MTSPPESDGRAPGLQPGADQVARDRALQALNAGEQRLPLAVLAELVLAHILGQRGGQRLFIAGRLPEAIAFRI